MYRGPYMILFDKILSFMNPVQQWEVQEEQEAAIRRRGPERVRTEACGELLLRLVVRQEIQRPQLPQLL